MDKKKNLLDKRDKDISMYSTLSLLIAISVLTTDTFTCVFIWYFILALFTLIIRIIGLPPGRFCASVKLHFLLLLLLG